MPDTSATATFDKISLTGERKPWWNDVAGFCTGIIEEILPLCPILPAVNCNDLGDGEGGESISALPDICSLDVRVLAIRCSVTGGGDRVREQERAGDRFRPPWIDLTDGDADLCIRGRDEYVFGSGFDLMAVRG